MVLEKPEGEWLALKRTQRMHWSTSKYTAWADTFSVSNTTESNRGAEELSVLVQVDGETHPQQPTTYTDNSHTKYNYYYQATYSG